MDTRALVKQSLATIAVFFGILGLGVGLYLNWTLLTQGQAAKSLAMSTGCGLIFVGPFQIIAVLSAITAFAIPSAGRSSSRWTAAALWVNAGGLVSWALVLL